ncbi:hypothetical protein GCM10027360_21260 [Amycolatopsis echigonensis]
MAGREPPCSYGWQFPADRGSFERIKFASILSHCHGFLVLTPKQIEQFNPSLSIRWQAEP